MEKIKSLLHPHGHDKDREAADDVTHETKSTNTAGQSGTGALGTATSGHEATTIHDQKTGHNITSSATSETPKFSNTPNVGAGTSGDNTHLGRGSHLGDNLRPNVGTGTYDGASEASIKSGVIGFASSSSSQGHAALPSNNSAEGSLQPNQIVGEGNIGTNTGSGLRNETVHGQPSVLPVPPNTGYQASSTQQLGDSSSVSNGRSFPLTGGVTSGHQDHSSATHGAHDSHNAHRLNTNEHELGTKEHDHHGREGFASVAGAAVPVTAAAHGQSSTNRGPATGSLGNQIVSPTGHSHVISSVAEHNIHPDALHAAGARPLNTPGIPGHGPPDETPHINTGTLLDYEKAFGSDPHTQHTGLLSYRPQTVRTDTNPHIPGEFPEATPEIEQSTPILGGANVASGTSSTDRPIQHDLRHTGTLNDPSSKSASQLSSHHLGRDGAIAGGAAVAGLGAAAAHHKHEASVAGSGSLYEEKNPYNSKALDPRVTGGESRLNDQRFDPSPTTSSAGPQALSGSSAPIVPPKTGERQHNYGRDTAVAGAAATAGYGAYEAAKTYGDHRNTQPVASMQEQRYDPTAAGAHASNPVPATSEYNYNNPDVAALASATGTGALGHHGSTDGQAQQAYTTAQMSQRAQGYKAPEITDSDLGPRDNSSRNAALGAGAGLAGATAAAYGISHHGHNPTHTSGMSAQPGSSSLPQSSGSLDQGEQYPYNTDSVKSHQKRDSAFAAGAGALVGTGAGYAYGQRTQPHFDSKEQERLDKETAKRQHELEKKHEKEVHKLEKEHEKDLKKHEKDAAHHEESERKGSLLGFLHRDKSKKESSPETTPRHSDEHHYGRNAAIAGGVGAGAAGLVEHESDDQFGHGTGYKGRNLLHKDPPPGHPARAVLEGGNLHANNRIGVDGPIGTVDSGVDGRTGEHHYGRNAAIGGGVLGVGALAGHGLLTNDRTEPSTLSSQTGGIPVARETAIPGQHTSSHLAGHTSTLPDRTSEHHYGRDAALGAGALGAGGYASHELHNKNRVDHTSAVPGYTDTSLGSSLQGTVPSNTASAPLPGNDDHHVPAHHTFVSGKREHIGVDGPIGDPNMISGDRQTRKGVWGAHPVEDLAKDHTVIEPRTGLPMNIGRYGDGTGGTDGGLVAHHDYEIVPGVVPPGTADIDHAKTNWEDVAKKNTIY